jgi:HJR/Mrr/RecB family endonuclease
MVELKSESTSVKGLALETLAVRILYELGLTPVAFRERGAENDGAEVDLIAEGTDTHFHRWMVQCKNATKVHVGALAKEVGMAVLYRAQVVLLVTTGEFTSTVRQNARQLAETSGHQAILIDEDGLATYLNEGVAGLFRQFEHRAREILEWKAAQRSLKAEGHPANDER